MVQHLSFLATAAFVGSGCRRVPYSINKDEIEPTEIIAPFAENPRTFATRRRHTHRNLLDKITEVVTDSSDSTNSAEKDNLNATYSFESPFMELLPTSNSEENSGSLNEKENDDTKNDNNPEKETGPTLLHPAVSNIFDITEQWKEASQDESTNFWNIILDPITDDSDDSDNQNGDEESEATIRPQAQSTGAKEGSLKEYNRKAKQRDPDLEEEQERNENSARNSKEGSSSFWQPFLSLIDDEPGDKTSNDANDKNNINPSQSKLSLQDTAERWMGYLSPGGGTEQSIRNMVDTARETAVDTGDVTDEKSFREVLSMLRQYSGELRDSADKYFGTMDISWSQLYPTSLFYYIEQQDETKNPSWKRRMHRFYPGIGVDQMNDLNDALTLARVSYLDSIEKVKERLNELTEPYELVYCDVGSKEPGKPAHYIAIKQHQPSWSPALEMVLGIRGTKTITDAITDLLFEDTDYRGGKAHSGMLQSGEYIVSKHLPLLQSLLKSSGKARLKLKIVGHSLGAGVASIVGMEINDQPEMDVEVFGFGTPALMSQDLGEQMQDCMTTVIADDDVVPRLSAPTLINALLDVMEYDYVPSARRDIEHALTELQRIYPMIVTSDGIDKIMALVDELLAKYLIPSIKPATMERMDPVLFPPGQIVHFYRDGLGISGSLVPNTFFHEIDVKRRMIDDHLFHSGYEQMFLDIMRLHFKDHSFQFDNPVTPVDDDDNETTNSDSNP